MGKLKQTFTIDFYDVDFDYEAEFRDDDYSICEYDDEEEDC